MRATGGIITKRHTSVAEVLRRLEHADVMDIVDVICANHRVTREQVASRLRTKNVADARANIWRALRNHPERLYTFTTIARLFGRDHSTVVNTINPITKAKNRARQRARWDAIKAGRPRPANDTRIGDDV